MDTIQLPCCLCAAAGFQRGAVGHAAAAARRRPGLRQLTNSQLPGAALTAQSAEHFERHVRGNSGDRTHREWALRRRQDTWSGNNYLIALLRPSFGPPARLCLVAHRQTAAAATTLGLESVIDPLSVSVTPPCTPCLRGLVGVRNMTHPKHDASRIS